MIAPVCPFHGRRHAAYEALGTGSSLAREVTAAHQDVWTRGRGTADNKAVTRCQSALTGQELGRWRRIRSLYCLIGVATLKRGSITVEGWA